MKHLDEYVIGQEKAKKILAVAVYNHYSRVNENLRQQQIQESLTAISSTTLQPSTTNPIYYGSSVLMNDGPSTPDPIIEPYNSPPSSPASPSSSSASSSTSTQPGSDAAGGASNDMQYVPGRRKWVVTLSTQSVSCENSIQGGADSP